MSMTDIICYLLTILEDELPPDEAGELLLVHMLGVARHWSRTVRICPTAGGSE